MPKNGILSFFAFLKTCTAHTPPCFCCKGRQSPWQKPANLYSTKCRIFMRQNPLSRSQCTTRARPSGETNFFPKKIFYSSENFCPHKNSKKILKKFFYFLKNIFGKNFLKKFWKKFFFYFLNLKLIYFFYLNKIYFYKKFF